MNEREYEQMYALEEFYWWFVARRKLVAEWMGKLMGGAPEATSLLDVGCGTGLNTRVLAKFGRVFGLDSSETALAFSGDRGMMDLVHGNVEDMEFESDSFQAATALDVLEHTDDDMAALRELHRVIAPGGTLLITVPAYGFLWSEHDEALHHRRRYTAHELRNKLAVAGLQVERCTYYISLLFFPILGMRIVQNIFKRAVEARTSHVILPSWVNWLLIRTLDLERLALRFINLPMGVSIVCIARKGTELRRESEKSAEQMAVVD